MTMTWKKLLATGAAAGAMTLAVGVPAAHAESPEVPVADSTGTLTSPHFSVTVHKINRTGDHGQFTDADVTVCADHVAGDGTTRVSWDPWTLTDVEGTEYHPGDTGSSPDTSFPKGDPTQRETQLHEGECANGVLTFPTPDTQSKELVYRNGHGETLVWRFDS